MKVYAKTLNPEWVNPDFYLMDEEEGNVMIGGNRDFKTFNYDMVEKIVKMFDDYGYVSDYYYHNKLTEFITDYLPKKENGKRYSPKQIKMIKDAMESKHYYFRDTVEEVITTCLSIIKGKKYAVKTIRGCSQSDWNIAYYPVDEANRLNYIEAVYFNTGVEVCVGQIVKDDSEEELENAEQVEGDYYFYTTLYNDDDIKEEIAKEVGCKKEDVVLFVFDGYVRSESYRRC